MKKAIFAILTAVTLMFICTFAVYATGDDLEILPGSGFSIGDVNMDKNVNIKDSTSIQKYVAGLIELNDEQLLLADVDLNGNVNVKDATYIQKQLAGLIGSEKPTIPNTQATTVKDPDKPIELPFVPAL